LLSDEAVQPEIDFGDLDIDERLNTKERIRYVRLKCLWNMLEKL
jgi:hypothetical protein